MRRNATVLSTALVALLALGLQAASAGDRVWRWVDDDGVVHYSDRPRPGADEIQLRTRPPGRDADEPPRATPDVVREPRPDERDDGDAQRYESLEVAQPAEEEVLWNIGGNLNVQLSLSPSLRSGHRVRVYYDGERLEELPGTSLSFQLTEVWRGEHTLRAEVIDREGNVLIESPTRTFYVQQTSIQNPQRRR